MPLRAFGRDAFRTANGVHAAAVVPDGPPPGTLAGAFFIGILNNGLNLFHVETYDQLMVKGVVYSTAGSRRARAG